MKKLAILFLAFIMVIPLTACGSDTNGTGDNGTLSVYVWTEYVPDSVIEKFEDETGIEVNVSTFSSNEDMLAKVKSESEGAFDIVQPSDYMVTQMADQGLLEEINHDKLTNLSNIDENYLDMDYDPGNIYSIPYQGGVAAIAVNTDKVTEEITSYADLFKAEYKNSIVVLDDYRAVIGMTARSLGYSMNETDQIKLAEIKDRLLKAKNNIKLYDSDSPKSALIAGDCTIGFCWNAEIAMAMEENPNIEIVFPEEGPYVFMDNWTVPKGAKNYDNAMKFINFMLEPENAQLVMEEYPYINPNKVAVEAMGDEYSSNLAKNPPSETIAKGEYVGNLSPDVLKIYDQMWTELKK